MYSSQRRTFRTVTPWLIVTLVAMVRGKGTHVNQPPETVIFVVKFHAIFKSAVKNRGSYLRKVLPPFDLENLPQGQN